MLHLILFPSSIISLRSEGLPTSCTKQLAAVAKLSSSPSMSLSLVKRQRSNINSITFSWILGSILWGKADLYHSILPSIFFFKSSLSPQVSCSFFSVPYWSNYHSFCLLQPKHLSLCFLISPPFPSSFIYMYVFHQAYKSFPIVLKQALFFPPSRCQICCSQGLYRKIWKTEQNLS